MNVTEFEELAQKTYAKFGKYAKAYHYSFSRTTVTKNATPCMLFLGNHSSGKSSLINWLIGGVAVQDVGLAPTDDGFTILTYGETDEDICGPAAVARLPAEFAGLKDFGNNFLQHLRIKIRNRELLKSVTLIDSPGMIDAAEKTVSRAYDFDGIVHFLAELCDMVFFMLDPDKPGTTGETVKVYSNCLKGMEAKLMVLFNKCDTITSPYDFARVYGNVCWNLARAINTKDLPKIWTIYSGDERNSVGTGIPMTDFNSQRNEFRETICHDAAARRRDNVLSQTQRDFLGLSIRMRVVNRFMRELTMRKVLTFLCGMLLAPICGYGVSALSPMFLGTGSTFSFVLGAVFAFSVFAAAFILSRLVKKVMCDKFANGIQHLFDKEYKVEMSVGKHDDLKQVWTDICEETSKIIRDALIDDLPVFGDFHRRRLDAYRRRLDATAEKLFRRELQGKS